MVARRLVPAVLLVVSVVGCGSGETEGEFALKGTWINESRDLAKKIVISSAEESQSFTNVDDTEPWGEAVCVIDDEWTDDAGDVWYLENCTETVIDTGEVVSWCELDRVSADGSVWEWNWADPGSCPKGHGPDDPPVFRYERADQ